jgi:hypothetical protein
MKLSAGNPNQMKKAAMRVNQNSASAAFIKTSKEKTNAVLPPQMNVWDRSLYVPENIAPARVGADNHKQHKSRGF